MLIENGISVLSKTLKVEGVLVKETPPEVSVARYPIEQTLAWTVPTMTNL